MDNNTQEARALEIAEAVRDALDEKQGIDVTILAVAKQTVLADYFVVSSGSSTTQVKALADNVEFRVSEKLGIKPARVEGFSDSTWTLIDYGCVVVHVFTREGREFYKLEKLWKESDAKPVSD